MRNLVAVFSILLAWTPVMTCAKTDNFSSCLPKNVQLKMVLQEEVKEGKKESKPLTVGEKLSALKAHCKNGKLLDQHGKEIRFVHLIGCWGNPPDDYQEQLNQQESNIAKLKEKYIVIEISCAQDTDRTVIH